MTRHEYSIDKCPDSGYLPCFTCVLPKLFLDLLTTRQARQQSPCRSYHTRDATHSPCVCFSCPQSHSLLGSSTFFPYYTANTASSAYSSKQIMRFTSSSLLLAGSALLATVVSPGTLFFYMGARPSDTGEKQKPLIKFIFSFSDPFHLSSLPSCPLHSLLVQFSVHCQR